jgi:hypothetical protein
MASFLRSLLAILRSLYEWLIYLLRLLAELMRRTRPDRRSERDKRAAKSPCVPIDDPAFVRPDPLIYSQEHLMALGLAVTWDNPDIVLYRGGVPVSSHDLEPATQYEVRARIWNDSFDAPAVNMPVHLSFLDFGIGTTPIAVGSTIAWVGVKGSASCPAFASIPWTTPDRPGHYCLKVTLDPIDDRDTSNNVGQENTDVRVSHSPVAYDFLLRNDTRRHHRYRFEIDGYALGRRPPCKDRDKDKDKEGRDRERRERRERHRRGSHPLPAGWTVEIEPATPSLAPGAQITVAVTITPPDGFVGVQRINVNAWHEDGFAGGVTLTVVGEG